jgi:tetratricopeptide (TPR) repeat protein
MCPPSADGAPGSLAAKLNQAVALHRAGQLGGAQKLYQDILRHQPRHFDALHMLGVIAAATGNPRQAVHLMSRALDINPLDAIAHNNLGLALHEVSMPEAALSSFDRAISLRSNYAEAHFNRGNVFRTLERRNEALAAFESAISLREIYPDAHSNCGIVQAELQRWDAALASYDRAIAQRRDFAVAHYNRAGVFCHLRLWDRALADYDRCVALQPEHAEAWANRSFVLHEMQRPDDALASCDRAIALQPRDARAHCNRATVLVSVRRVEEALASYDRAVALEPENAFAHVNRGLCRLLKGDFEQGWPDYEWRWRDTQGWVIHEHRKFSQPLWLGEESLAGKTILLQSEQGYGDTLQFCRYAKFVAERGARVILEVPDALVGLLQSLEGVAQIHIQGEPLPAFDYYCPLMSLPLALKTTLRNIPAQARYVSVDDRRLQNWKYRVAGTSKARLGESSKARVGIAWSGGFRPARPELWSVNARRNIPLATLALLKDVDMDFYSLQKGEAAEAELSEAMSGNWDGPIIQDCGRELHDFADTASLIEHMDLVISVDTAVAHLAGALGKPVWILNRFDACWRWLLDVDSSPWYPSARLFRQPRPGDWEDVIQRVRVELLQWRGRD